MYFITTLRIKSEWKNDRFFDSIIDSRCVGYYKDLENAKRSIEDNSLDIHEYNYTYAVIEQFGQGIYYHPEEIQWYVWENGKYVESFKPEKLESTISFAIG